MLYIYRVLPCDSARKAAERMCEKMGVESRTVTAITHPTDRICYKLRISRLLDDPKGEAAIIATLPRGRDVDEWYNLADALGHEVTVTCMMGVAPTGLLSQKDMRDIRRARAAHKADWVGDMHWQMGARRKSLTSTACLKVGSLIVHGDRLMVVRKLEPEILAVPVGYSSTNEVVLTTHEGQIWWNEANEVIPPGEVEVVSIYKQPT